MNETVSDSVSIALTGSGGAGVITAGSMLLSAASRSGWYGLFGRSAGPQIRGGEAAALIRLARHPVAAPDDRFQILVAIDWKNIERFADELPLGPDSLVLADPANGEVPEVIAASGAKLVELPMKQLAKAAKRGRPNMVALGAVASLIGLGEELLGKVVEATLAAKAAELRAASLAAIQAGMAAAATLGVGLSPEAPPEAPPVPALGSPPGSPPVPPPAERWTLSGNQAAGLGALRGGVRFVAAYPITPATEMLEWLAPNLGKVGGTLVQAEDELASINMIIGASYGGTPSLTATSGPGLALMSESIGLAVAAEVPIVVVDVMRGGPSTGIPTKSEQSDLNIALFGLHGDAPHLVLAPSGIADCVFTLQWAVHLAEAMQVPAIVLSDQSLGQSQAVIDRPADLAFVGRRLTAEEVGAGYQRYAEAAGGVSPMALPGTPGGQYTADGLEHGPSGLPSSRTADHGAQLDKRRRKIEDFDYGEHWAQISGSGDLAIITWGSAAGAVREALGRLEGSGPPIRLVVPRLLAPLRGAELAAALQGTARTLVIEQNHSAQFFHYLKGHSDLPGEVTSFHRPGPQPLRPGELATRIRAWRAT